MEHEKCSEMMFHLAASNNVFAMYPFVPLTQYGVINIMKMTAFFFSKFICLPLTIAIRNLLLNKNHPQIKDVNVVGVACYTDERPR